MKRTYGLLGWFLHYSFLSMLGMLGISGYILADTFFVSLGLGADGLAALNSWQRLAAGNGGGHQIRRLQKPGREGKGQQSVFPWGFPVGMLCPDFCSGGLLFVAFHHPMDGGRRGCV